ncbi:hypothetical protein PHYPSEUDO_015101 [Phytophthora pseudosyringae]|uniref:Temptin Cys/Cys disulfide domain-containing protein n=1 Tax=Phytophthora pseudosyringae TaxID=221518 RepID=A0A8T1W0Z9_9STRA|nr:hypothetical protein PHYPSEUDO_015101 [Phytophthora pseudosyringae]
MVRFTTAVPAISLVSWSMFVAPAVSHEAYARKVPNGENVVGVKAVGHSDPDGGGVRNEFGRAFYDAGHEWTKDLCQEDSDGDGQTNGEELGDPCCEWTEESASKPAWTSGVSNPGDDASKSNKTLWPAYECSNATSSSQSHSASTSSASTSDSASDSGSSASVTLTGVTASVAAGAIALLLVFIA